MKLNHTRSLLAKRFICLILLAFICACAPKIPDDFKTEDELYQYALALQQKAGQDTQTTLKFLKAFRSRYPLSQRTPEVELMIGDLHTQRGESIEALDIFEQFVQLHPNHARLHYAILQQGKAHMAQIPASIERDQTHVRSALEKFSLISNDPTYRDEVSGLIRKMQYDLAARDRYVANYYLKRKQWKAAEGRLLALVENYPFMDYRELALADLVKVYLNLSARQSAEQRLQELEKMGGDEQLLQTTKALFTAAESGGAS